MLNLLTDRLTFLLKLFLRIGMFIKTRSPSWWRSLFSSPLCWPMNKYCSGNLFVGHSWNALRTISSAQVCRCSSFRTGYGANSFISGWWQENVPSGKKFTRLCILFLLAQLVFWHDEQVYFLSGLLNKVLLVVPTPQRNSHCCLRKGKFSTQVPKETVGFLCEQRNEPKSLVNSLVLRWRPVLSRFYLCIQRSNENTRKYVTTVIISW